MPPSFSRRFAVVAVPPFRVVYSGLLTVCMPANKPSEDAPSLGQWKSVQFFISLPEQERCTHHPGQHDRPRWAEGSSWPQCRDETHPTGDDPSIRGNLDPIWVLLKHSCVHGTDHSHAHSEITAPHLPSTLRIGKIRSSRIDILSE